MAICALYPQEAVGGMADPRGQNFVPEHGIDHGALPIARPMKYQLSMTSPKSAFWAFTTKLPT